MELDLDKITPALIELLKVQSGDRSRVRIKTKEKCPVCGKAFTQTPLGFLCLRCHTVPRRFYVYLSWKGRKIKIYSFKDGQPLSSYELARRACEIITHEIELGAFDPSRWVSSDVRKYLFETQWKRWMDLKAAQVQRKELSPGYFAQLKSYEKHVLAFFRGKDIREIKKADMTDFWRALDGKNLSPKTVQNLLRLVRGFLNFLKSEELIERVPDIPEVKVPKTEPEVLDEEEQRFLLDYIRDALPEHYPIFLFMARQGVRPGEACALRWEDLDLAKGFVWIRRTFSARRLKDTTKGRRARLIPLDPEVHAFFLEYVRKVAPFPKSFVFLQPHGKPYSDYVLNRVWKRIVSGFLVWLDEKRETGRLDPRMFSLYAKFSKGLRLYDATRHSRLTQFVAQGKSLYLVQAFAGHSDPRITERYVHLAADKLKQLFEEPGKVIPFPGAKTGSE